MQVIVHIEYHKQILALISITLLQSVVSNCITVSINLNLFIIYAILNVWYFIKKIFIMAQIVGIVAAQIAADEAKKMLQNQRQNQEQNQSPPDDDQSPLLSAPSGAIFNSDSAMAFASSMLPKTLDSVLQINGSKGGQNQIGSVLDEGEEILDQGISKRM